jgi:hypothetical protein
MNDKLEGIWKEVVVAYRGTIPTFSYRDLGRQRNICQYTQCPDRDSNQASPEYGALPPRQGARGSVVG